MPKNFPSPLLTRLGVFRNKVPSTGKILLPYNKPPYVAYCQRWTFDNETFHNLHKYCTTRKLCYSLNDTTPRYFITEDVALPSEDYLTFRIFTGLRPNLTIETARRGVALKSDETYDSILKYTFSEFPPLSYGTLLISSHVPFRPVGDPTSAMILPTTRTKILPVPTYKELTERYKFKVISKLSPEQAEAKFTKIKDQIQTAKNKQIFGKEETLVINPPSHLKRKSNTLMFFNGSHSHLSKTYSDKDTTDSHYHPGSRLLKISTCEHEAGVVLNFCGISENIKDRPDTQRTIHFPPNAECELFFDSFIHHNFLGSFVCDSEHPEEGKNIIKAFYNGKAKNKFLKFATVDSRTHDNHSLSAPEEIEVRLKQK